MGVSVGSTSAGGIGQVFVWASFVLIGHRPAGARLSRRSWPVGQPVRVQHRLRVRHPGAATCILGRRYPIRAIAFLPIGVATFLVGYAFTLPQDISPLVPALDNPPLLTIHVAMAMISYGIFAVSFGAAVGYLVQGRENRVVVAATGQGARRGRLPRGDHRLPDLRHADHPGLVLGEHRLGPLLGLGPQGNVAPW